MGLLFFYTVVTIFAVFLGFIFNYQTNEENRVPHWFLLSVATEILMFVLYHACKRYIYIPKRVSFGLSIVLHDLMMVALFLYILAPQKYRYVASLIAYYVIFFSSIVWKRTVYIEEEETGLRRTLPRKTFIEMTNK